MGLYELFNLEGKVVIITGGTRYIGRDMIKLLAHVGATVVLVARNEEKLDTFIDEIKTHGYEIKSYPYDVGNIADIYELMYRAYHEFGQIDILINNALVKMEKPVEKLTEEDWNKVLDLNLNSVSYCCQAAAQYMKIKNQGKIINVSFQVKKTELLNGASSYCSSKGGLIKLTRSLANQWSEHQINVNSIAPSFIEESIRSNHYDDISFSSEVVRPLSRLARSKDLFGSLLLLSSSASDMITGQTIFVDGGRTDW